jgi:WD40 repeat protein
VLILQDDRMVSLDFHPNESQILYSTGDGGAHLINIRGDVPVREAMFLKTHESSSVIALFPDGTKFVAGGFGAQSSVNVDRTNAMVIWDFQTVSQTAVIPGHPASVIDLEFSPNGLWLISADNGGNAMITNVTQPETRINLNGIGARAVAFSPNSQFFAVAKSNGTIDLMIPATGAVITTFNGHTAGVTNVVFSPDSTLLASVGEDGTLRLWSTQTDQSAGVIQTGGRGIRDVAFNPAGNLIAVVGDDFTLRLFGIRAAA